ncbi:hypothetical protein [Paenibacillus macerans]|uniref:hypothetical protein n=1 Tax=Paenibacillus macerans TaxID=44252 RepID=UPI0022E86DD6|nr:hypothetical protein [Paenibacillus macerans]
MGLDVYVRWEGMTEKDQKAQITGFKNSGEKGYLRQSWGSLDAWDSVFNKVFGISWTDCLTPDWEGFNGEKFDIQDDVRKYLEEKKAMLQKFIDNPKPLDESLRQYFSDGGWEDAQKIVSAECKHMVDFIDLALCKPGAMILFS